MRKILLPIQFSLRTGFLVLILGITSNFSSAQCAFSGNLWTSYTPACTGSAETITTCAWGGDYMNISVVAGQTYTFSTCGATYDTQLTLFTNNGATYLAYNDDACGLQSTITWTATFTGTVQLQLNNYYCAFGSTCTTVTVTCNGGGGGGGSGPCASTNTIIGCGTSQGTTLTGTGSWNFSPCGFSTPGVESIWEFTPTTSGIHSLEIQSITGGWVDFAWAPAAGGCGPAPGTTWNCISDVLTPGNYGSMNWIAGQTYYILIDPETTATTDMTWYVDCPNPSGYPTGDCAGAIPICSDANFAVDPSGYGTINELCTYCTSNPGTNVNGVNMGCLLSGELNSTWMTITVAQGGTLEFSFGTPGAGYCFDWAMWDYDASTCNDIYNNTQAPVSCNWNTWCDGFTGMANVAPPGGLAEEFQPTMNVNTGDQFVIMLSNYSSAYTNVPLDFFGTADISCTPLPVDMINFTGENSGNFNVLNWSTASEFHNSHFEIERSADGQTYTKIGEVKGVGTSMEVSDYRFVDSDLSENMYYYRLNQVDINGAFKYSNTIAIATTGENHFKVVSTYPNPAKDVFFMDIFMDQDDEILISLIESSGKVVYADSKQFNQGNNHISIPVSEFAQGMYMVNVYNERTDSKEIIKLAIE